MKADSEGFLYPEIDAIKCVDCGKCKSVCQIHSNIPRNTIEPIVFAAKNKDEDVRSRSTSGGMFSVFADAVIKNGGTVYGVAFDDEFNILHKRAQTTEGYKEFMGSKYAQSNIGDTYLNVKKDLADGK